jgi:anti-sigma-K factor RskA
LTKVDIQAYIESGIIEAYVLGAVTDKERQEVECMSKIYEEIAAELKVAASTMESFASIDEVKPPAHLKAAILEEIAKSEPKVISIAGNKQETCNDDHTTETISDSTNNNQSWLRVAVAATFSYLYVNNNAQLTEIRQQLAVIVDSRDNVSQELEVLRNELSQTKTELAFLQDTATTSVPMKGIPEKAASALATVFWNERSSEAYISVASLPEAPAGKQYQLWAIVDGVPADMGVLEIQLANHLQKVVNIKNAVAFAVTLEDEGGSPTPTLSEMYVIGNVTS